MSTLLLTGATGMVGREILARAAADPRFGRVACLVRPAEGRSAQERLDELLDRVGVARDPRLVAVAGDVAEPDLGLTAADRAALEGVTHVIHGAATVAFDRPLEEARRLNAEGTRTVLRLCAKLRRLERLDAISTAYVAGRRGDLVREADLEHDRGFHNTYEQTKHEAEISLRAAMKDLPIAVHRPSIVVGDSRTGRTGAWKVLYWPLKVLARGWLPVIPYDPEGRLDIVPVDWVADAVLALSRDPRTLGRTFHLAAGASRDTTVEEVATVVYRRLRRAKPIRLPPAWFRALRPALLALPSKKLRRTLAKGIVYRPYFELRLRFDTVEADAALSPRRLECPRVLDYFDRIVAEALRTDFGARDAA